jgi:hypothetical protein
MTRARAEELAAAGRAQPPQPQRARGVSDRRAAINAMSKDVRILLGAGVLVIVAGLGWLAFGPRPARVMPVLGFVDAGPPKVPRAVDPTRPAFKLPWWK